MVVGELSEEMMARIKAELITLILTGNSLPTLLLNYLAKLTRYFTKIPLS